MIVTSVITVWFGSEHTHGRTHTHTLPLSLCDIPCVLDQCVVFGPLLSFLLFFYRPSLCPPSFPPVLCWPCPVPTPPACRPAFQRVQKAAKIKKKAVCNEQSKRKRLRPRSFHFLTFLLSHLCSSVSSPIFCLTYVKIVAQQFFTQFLCTAKRWGIDIFPNWIGNQSNLCVYKPTFLSIFKLQTPH